jgi:uncharacterized membrane protein YphA (DoxX/SURF4 family)
VTERGDGLPQRLWQRFSTGWDDFWFRPVSATNLAIVRIAYFLCLYRLLSIQRIWEPEAWDEFRFPLNIFKYIPLMSEGAAERVSHVMLIAIVLAAVGFMTRLSSTIAFLLVFYFSGMQSSYGKIIHLTALPVVMTGILTLSRSGDAFSIDSLLRRRWRWWPFGRDAKEPSSAYRWPLQVGCMYIAMVFFSAALSKLQVSGLDWVLSDSMTRLLGVTSANHGCYHAGSNYPEISRWIVAHHGLPQFLAGCVLVGEFFAPLILVSGPIRYLYSAGLLLMNIGFFIILGPDFRGLMISFAFVFPWAQLGQWVRARVRPHSAT